MNVTAQNKMNWMVSLAYARTIAPGMIVEPTREDMISRGAAQAFREQDNAGTFVATADGQLIGYVPNSQTSDDGEWLYYSQDVRKWLGLPY